MRARRAAALLLGAGTLAALGATVVADGELHGDLVADVAPQLSAIGERSELAAFGRDVVRGARARLAGNARSSSPSPTATIAAATAAPPTAHRAVPNPDPGRPLAPLQPRQLTGGGCCAGAWWSADSRRLHFIDRPDGAPATAIYGVEVWPPGSQPRIVDTEPALSAGAPRYVVRPAGGYSLVEDLETGLEWPLPTGGNPVRVSPDGQRVVWWTAYGGRAGVDRQIEIHASDIEGTDPRLLTQLWGATVVGFVPDTHSVVITGRSVRDEPQYVLAVIDTESGETEHLARGSWLSDATLSRQGTWIAYMTSLDRENPKANGVWVVPTAGGEPHRLPFTGAFRWRDDRWLAYVPMDLDATHHSLWQYDARIGTRVQLIDPSEVPIRVAGNDWSISPDGFTLAFRSAVDGNLWAVDMPTVPTLPAE